jgi:hypothetical protein
MRLVRRIERAAEQTDAHAGGMGRQHDAFRLTLCPCGSGLRRRK